MAEPGTRASKAEEAGKAPLEIDDDELAEVSGGVPAELRGRSMQPDGGASGAFH